MYRSINAPDANNLLFRCVMIHFMVPRRLSVPDVHLQCFSQNRQFMSPYSLYRRGVYRVPILVQQRHCTLEPKPHLLFSLLPFLISNCSLTLLRWRCFISRVYFRLLIVFTAISTRPSLASLSGKSLMLWMAFSA